MIQALRLGQSYLYQALSPSKLKFSFQHSSQRTMSSDQGVTPSGLTGSQAQLPELSPRERSRWNKLSVQMSYFHDMFKHEFNTIYELADGSFNQRGMSLTTYLRQAQSLNHHLTMHHTIEERYMFPQLAKRIPAFKEEHIKSHKGIHDGLEGLNSLLSKVGQNPSLYSPSEMRACLDSFKEVLFVHMDEEVADLQGDNLRKYFTLEEVEQIGV